jgi:carotenoid cleavage dioxygenase
MTQPFPNDPFLTGAMAPFGAECDAPDLVIEGELPADLAGTYYRNGPDPLHPPREGDVYHWFDGDGMIQCFEIGNGRIAWRNRWVRSEKFKVEQAAGKSLFGVFNNPMTGDPSVADVEYNTANTHIVQHAGKLLALMEGALPTQIEHKTLNTLGTVSFDGQIDGPVTAHPKFDEATGEMIFFGYQAAGPGSSTLRYNVADRNGNLIRNEFFEAPFPAMVHDFFVTETHAIFPIFPLTTDIGRAMSGGPMMAWEPDKGTHFGVIPRDGTAEDVRWFNMEARFMFHMMNAWTDGTKLHADVTGSNATQFAPKLDGTMADVSDGVAPTFRRWSVDLADNTNAISEELFDDMACEFPRTDDRWMTKPYRHGYAVGAEGKVLSSFNTLIHYDTQTGGRKTYNLGDNRMVGEPVLAPRVGGTDEADGYMIMLAYNESTAKSDLMIFRADAVDEGPVAVAKMPLRIPAGFHGSWVAA